MTEQSPVQVSGGFHSVLVGDDKSEVFIRSISDLPCCVCIYSTKWIICCLSYDILTSLQSEGKGEQCVYDQSIDQNFESVAYLPLHWSYGFLGTRHSDRCRCIIIRVLF